MLRQPLSRKRINLGTGRWQYSRECDGGAACPCRDIIDVDTTQWYHEALDYVVSRGYMVGSSGTTFSLNMPTNRAMIATILNRLENEPAVDGTINFDDMAENQWYAAAMRWANAHGLV